MSKAYEELTTRLAEVVDLASGTALGSPHDDAAQRRCPPRNSWGRSKLVHTKVVDPEFGRLLDEAGPWAEEQGYDSLEASLVRVVRRDYEKLVRVPPSSPRRCRAPPRSPSRLAGGTRGVGLGEIPAVSREGDRVARQYVDCFEPADEDYDHLLDIYEPGMKTAEVRAVFDELKAGLVPLIAEVAERRRGRRLVPIR